VLKIAFATDDGTAVDQHFGWCTRFDVFEIDQDRYAPVGSRTPRAAEGEEGTIASRLEVVRDCAIVYVTSIGPAAAARVVNAGIMPVKLPEGTAVPEVLDRLQEVLRGTPPPWLRKVLRQHSPEQAPTWSPS
jgi:nitrogen fixation protein NifX